jgi:hypothetical protein
MMNLAEQWIDVPGFESRYQVSNFGRVRSYAKGKSPRILKALPDTKGYPQVALRKDGHSLRRRVHTLVLLAFVGERPAEMECRHLDGKPTNNVVSNLAYGTHSENELDQVRHGTHHNAKKIECKYGHEFTASNVFRKSNGGRGCITCRQIRDRKRYTATKSVLSHR